MIPGALGLLGATGAGLAVAPALRVLNLPLLVVTVLVFGRAWYLDLNHPGRSVWRRRSRLILLASTVLATALWVARFAGLLGMRPWPMGP